MTRFSSSSAHTPGRERRKCSLCPLLGIPSRRLIPLGFLRRRLFGQDERRASRPSRPLPMQALPVLARAALPLRRKRRCGLCPRTLIPSVAAFSRPPLGFLRRRLFEADVRESRPPLRFLRRRLFEADVREWRARGCVGGRCANIRVARMSTDSLCRVGVIWCQGVPEKRLRTCPLPSLFSLSLARALTHQAPPRLRYFK